MQFIDLQLQYQSLKEKIDKRVQTVLDHGAYIMGPEVAELEEKLADFVGVKHAVSCANGTDALQISLMALGIGPGDTVFCPTFTFFATAEAIAFVGATPAFVDSDVETFNLSPLDLEKQIKIVKESGGSPAAIISVDLFGLLANYDELEKVAKKHGIKLIEDAAQGFGAETNGKRAGSYGDIATTSFFPAKPLGCYGDGGAVFTDCDEYATLLRSLRVHGKGTDKYDNVRIGMNSRLDTIQAAILLEKLAVFPQEIVLRNEAANFYEQALGSIFVTPKAPVGYSSVWAQYTIRDENRPQLMQHCKENGVPTAVYYGTCMHQQTAFSSLDYKLGDFAVAEKLSEQVFSLPMHPYLDKDTMDKVVGTLVEYKNRNL